MHFKRIEIHGFKSFAEPVVVEFDRGITCVVGPNGSGKSNICDAIRWVLGAQSAKMLRGDKMEDVIFAGTASRKSRGMAEVTLIIDNSQGELSIDYNEVAITRRMYRSGESEYLINNNSCRMKDIRELIMDTGIGVEGYSIIGQGKISDIISNNTESIREVLEETAGIVMYRSKKAEAERKLKSATNNMERVSDIIGEIEGRIGGLKEDSHKATEYLSLKERHKILEINITLKNIESIELKNEYIKDDVLNLQNQIEAESVAFVEASQKVTIANEEREQVDNQIEEKRQEQLKIIEELNTLINQEKINKERITSIVLQKETITEEIETLKEKLEKEKENTKDLYEKKDKAQEKLAFLQKDLLAEEKIYRESLETLENKKIHLDERNNRLFTLKGEINNKSAELLGLEALDGSLKKRESSIIEEKSRGDGVNKNSEDELREAKEKHQGIEETRASLKKEEDNLQIELNENIGIRKTLTEDLSEIKVKIGQLSERKKTFEELATNYDGYNNAVKFVMKAKISGIEGVVAELINVPAGLETAVETALGATIQNIITVDDDSAKKAINFLKSNSAGRLTFLPLKSIKPRGVQRDKNIESAKGFKGYGVDCITYNNKYNAAIEYLLGNVVIMDSMDNAVTLSKAIGKSYKLVTMDGEIINASGSITGGKYKNKSANILERKGEIAQLGEEIEILSKKISSLALEIEKRNGEAKEQESLIIEKRAALRASELEQNSNQNTILFLENALTDHENSAEKLERELSRIADERNIIEENKKKISTDIKAKEEEIELLMKEVSEGNKTYETEKSTFDNLSLEITEKKLNVQSCENDTKRAEEIVNHIESTILDLKNNIATKVSSLEGLQTEEDRICASNGNEGEDLLEKEKQKNDLENNLQKLAEKKKSIGEELTRTGKEREDLESRLEKLKGQKYELEIKQTRQETQLENAKEKLWDEFEVSYLQAIEFKKTDFAMSSAVKENREIKNRIKELGDINIGAIKEYEEVKERYEFLTEQRNDITKSMDELNKIIADMDKVIRSKFKESFEEVVKNFEIVFRDLYGGGNAQIRLSDESNPFDSEIEIIAQPPGKQLKNINLLSGGEKTMTAIALMFAVLKTKPTPCCILDEVEAALDDSNLEIFGNYIRSFNGVQFTLVTHQKSTMEHADVMYGVTMPESGISKVYSLKMGEEAII